LPLTHLLFPSPSPPPPRSPLFPYTTLFRSDRRAYIVADKFTTLGVEQGRIVAKGYGASTPVAPNTTLANRAKNRRLLVILNLNPDRKSTRLNSSHVSISYAVFCLKKKNKKN